MTVVSCPTTSYVRAYTSSGVLRDVGTRRQVVTNVISQTAPASKQSRNGRGMLFINHRRSADFLCPPDPLLHWTTGQSSPMSCHVCRTTGRIWGGFEEEHLEWLRPYGSRSRSS